MTVTRLQLDVAVAATCIVIVFGLFACETQFPSPTFSWALLADETLPVVEELAMCLI